MGSINKVILIGNLGADPETTQNEKGMIANINIATTEYYRDRQSGQTKQSTEWHRIVLFNKTAEIAHQFLRKGSKVYIEGRLRTRKWQDQNGVDRYTTEIVARDMQMLDGQQPQSQSTGSDQQPPAYHNQSQGGYQQQGGYQTHPQQPQQRPAPSAPRQQPVDNPYGHGNR